MCNKRCYWLAAIFLSLFFHNAFASNLSMDAKRATFLQAKAELALGHYPKFVELSQQLQDYPLYPYLIYADLTYRLRSAKPEEILDFVRRYGDSPLANRLYENWLYTLAQQNYWREFLNYYQPFNSESLTCLHLKALIQTAQQDAALNLVKSLWQQDRPAPCTAYVLSWVQKNQIDPALLWHAINIAMAHNATSTANNLVSLLSPEDKATLVLWEKVNKTPAVIAQVDLFSASNAHTKDILMSGIMRLARKNSEMLLNIWPTLQNKFQFDAGQQQIVIRALALGLATDNHAEAAAWLAKVDPAYANQNVRDWRIRTALRTNNWTEVLRWINALPEIERKTTQWRYWRARALEALQQNPEATLVYKDVAQSTDFYGFLASTRLQQPLHFNNTPLLVTEEELSAIANLPGIQRADELYKVNMPSDARREWNFTTQDMNKSELKVAAKLAEKRHWYDRAVVTITAANFKNDLWLRFPLGHAEQVMRAAKQLSLNPAWIFAIIRQESAFIPDSKSSANALGLMQLIPDTAKLVAKQIKIPYTGPEMLMDTQTNITLGSTYLKTMLDVYKGNTILATASYNAGSSPVNRWQRNGNNMTTDVWIELIPWQETRDYVKRVLTYTSIYEYALGTAPSFGRVVDGHM